MKEKIEQLAKGNFEFVLPFICLSEEEIYITVEAGQIYQGSIELHNSMERKMRGVLYSTNRFLILDRDAFCEAKLTINYTFDATHRSAGEVVKGEIWIISDCGETSVPFTFAIEAPYVMTPFGKTKDLFQFTSVAQVDLAQAKELFRREDFAGVFLQQRERFQLIYHGLRKSITTSHAIEEFLCAIHKKALIQIAVDETLKEYLIHQKGIKDKIKIVKDCWGYAEIKVSSDAPFIQLEQKYIWTHQFDDHTFELFYRIDETKLRPGNNYGHIQLKTIHQTITVNCTCKYQPEGFKKRSIDSEWKKVSYKLTQNYLNLRYHQIDRTTYRNVVEALLEGISPSQHVVADLIHIHLAIVSEEDYEAKRLLNKMKDEVASFKKEKPLSYYTYLYLNALNDKQENTIKNAASDIRQYYENEDAQWRMLWFLFYLDKRYQNNRNRKLQELKRQYERGATSPILYYEAVGVYNEEPYLLRELTGFEIQVINFGIKHWLISKEVAWQFTYLAGKAKKFHPVVFWGLRWLYDKYHDTQILTAICSMLIKGLKKAPKYFKWYRLGVEAQLHITQLYEYYIYSMENAEHERLEQPILFYFLYNNNLNDRQKTQLYANIVHNKNAYDGIYQSYYKKMELFALKQLEAHHINHNLAVLYQDCFPPENLNSEVAKYFPYIMYRHEFVCGNPNMVGVIIIHKELGLEEYYPLQEQTTLVDLFTTDYVVVFVDERGNRYCETIVYEIKPLIQYERYEQVCIKCSDHPALLLHLFDKYQSYQVSSELSMEIRKKIIAMEDIKESYRMECLTVLISHYYDHMKEVLLKEYLQKVNILEVKKSDQIRILEYMITWLAFDQVHEVLEQIGFEKIAINRLLKLCSTQILKTNFMKPQKFLLDLSYHVFAKGKYDETILNYLLRHYQGPTKQMYELWRISTEFCMDTHDLEERLLTQILFTEGYVTDSTQVFLAYYKGVTKRSLVRAYLSYYAYRYLVFDRVIHVELFAIMRRELNYEENDICLLAWLKYHSTRKEFQESELKFIDYHIHRLENRGIILPFFLDYRKVISLSDRIINQSFIEYIADPKKQVYIHYRLLNQKEYKTERMTNVMLGIHIKTFLLFHQEVLQYYITEEEMDEAVITESINLIYDEEDVDQDDSRYHRINMMLMALELKDEKTLQELMEQYYITEYTSSQCFRPL